MALIELAVAIVIIALLAVAFYGLWGRGKKGPGDKSLPEQAVDRAKGVECRSMLGQVRASIEMAKADTGQPPPTIPSDMAPYAKCPQTGQPYAYDPATGRVACTTPGHEGF
jgi:hypothetical protein